MKKMYEITVFINNSKLPETAICDKKLFTKFFNTYTLKENYVSRLIKIMPEDEFEFEFECFADIGVVRAQMKSKEFDTDKDFGVQRVCPLTKEISVVYVDIDDYIKWRSGTLVQDAFPYLSVEDREILITGFSKKAQKEIFGC